MSDISEIQVGGTTYTIADATAREDIADLHNATVHIVDKNIDIDGGAPTASIYDRGITFDDVDGNSIGFIQLDHETDGNYGISFGVNTLDDSVTHQIALELKSDGTPKCWISQPAVVRNALSAAASSHTHGSISNAGAITSDTTVTSGDKLIISDSSDSSKLKRSNIELGTSTATFLRNDGTWATPPGGSGGSEMVVLSYGTSTWADFIAAYNTNSIVYCRASSNANPASGAQTRMAFMAYVNANPPTSVEFQYYRSIGTHSATQQGDQVFIYTLNSSNTWTVTTREAATKIAAGDGLTQTYSSGTLTISAVATPNEIVVSTTEPTSIDTMLWIDPSNNATVMAAGVSF